MKICLLLVSLAILSAQAVNVGTPERTGLYHSCSKCAGFVNSLVKLGSESTQIEAEAYVPVNKQTKEDAAKSSAEAQASLAHEEKMCSRLGSELQQSCVLVSQIYGLENVAPIARVAPDLLCEQITECRTKNLGGHKIMTHEQVVSVLGDAMMDDAANDVLVQTEAEKKPGVSSGVMGMMSSLFKMRMQSQMMMQAMSMRQQLMENEHKMMQKIMRAMARNRAIRSELQHLKKMAYRAQPGNCDCCDACLPAKGGGGKGGKGGKKGGKKK